MRLDNLAIFCWGFIVVFFLWAPITSAEPLSSQTLSTPQLVKALKQGGHVIYMRHGTTNHTQKDTNRKNFEDCGNQRNLSDEGRIKLKSIAAAITRFSIPITEVVSSPYCRCKDTAQQVFGKYRIDLDLRFSISHNKDESEDLGQRLRAKILQADTTGGNVVFVGHSSNLRDGLGVWPKPEGVVVVFKLVDSEPILKGMIYPDEWAGI